MAKPELALYRNENNGDGRAYKHPFRTREDGKPLTVPSITTITNLEDKPALGQWASDLAIQWAVDNWFLLGSRSTEDAYRAGRYRWKDVRDERAEIGTEVHETIDAENTGSWDFPTDLSDEAQAVLVQWERFKQEWEINPLLSEFTVWSLEHDYAGTADGLWELTHKMTGDKHVSLVDVKTSRGTYGGHYMQLAALKYADVLMQKDENGKWIELPMPKFDKLQILHLRGPEYNREGKLTKDAFYNLIDIEDEDLRFKEFLCYRGVWEVRDQLKNRERERRFESSGF